jgi:hypothetical protein
MMKFFYENPDFIVKISQREDEHLRCWADVSGDKAAHAKDNLTRFAKRKSGGERYCAINLNNPGTVEIRIFRGNISPEGFFKNLEFAHASYLFTKEHGRKELTVDKFHQFLKGNQKEYPNLCKFLGLKPKDKKQCALSLTAKQ